MAGLDLRTCGFWNPRLETEHNVLRYKIYIYIQCVSDHTTFDLRNPTIPILIKKTLLNA